MSAEPGASVDVAPKHKLTNKKGSGMAAMIEEEASKSNEWVQFQLGKMTKFWR